MMRKQTRHRTLMTMMCSFMLMAAGAISVHAEETIPSRDIFVVYDDSGSMYHDFINDGNTTRWSKAKYSMEVLASMLDEKDTMNIYYMSDLSEKNEDEPRLSLKGSDKTKDNVRKIHEQRTYSGKTPIEIVENAFEDLEQSDADEKWLVVLTDGDFQKDGENYTERTQITKDLDDLIAEKDRDTGVVFIAVGEDITVPTEKISDKVYVQKAKESSEILSELTETGNIIFNANRLEDIDENGEFTIDIPMSQITVFVQGPDAKIVKLETADGKEAGTLKQPVSVQANKENDNDHETYKDSPPDTSLKGETAVFEGPFEPGTYRVVAENAATTEVYFKPLLKVDAWLEDSDGEKIENLTNLPAGDYTIRFGLVSGIDGSPLPQRNLINSSDDDVTYEAQVFSDGKLVGSDIEDGDVISLDEGDLEVIVDASFLKYNRVHTELNADIWREKVVNFTQEDQPIWKLTESGFEDPEPLTVQLTLNGQAPTEAEWNAFNADDIHAVYTTEAVNLDPPVVKKGKEPGELLITPDENQNEWTGKEYRNTELSLSIDTTVNAIEWKGNGTVGVSFQDARSWWATHADLIQAYWWTLPLGIGLLVLIAGYIPGIKKYLPKMQKVPEIDSHPLKRGERETTEPGKVSKDLSSTLIPYKAETATIQFAPNAERTIRNLHVKAIGNQKMKVVGRLPDQIIQIGSQTKEDLKRAEETRNGTSAEGKNSKSKKGSSRKGKKGKKADQGIKMRAGSEIVSRGENFEYTCQLKKKHK